MKFVVTIFYYDFDTCDNGIDICYTKKERDKYIKNFLEQCEAESLPEAFDNGDYLHEFDIEIDLSKLVLRGRKLVTITKREQWGISIILDSVADHMAYSNSKNYNNDMKAVRNFLQRLK